MVPIRRLSDKSLGGASSRPAAVGDAEAVELPQWLDEASAAELARGREGAGELPILGLPSPAPRRRPPFLKLRLWTKEFVLEDETIIIRTIKSALLVAKVPSL